MSGFYRLLNREFVSWLRFLTLLCLAAIVVPLLLLNAAVKDYNTFASHARYEHLYVSSGCALLFVLWLALLCLYFLKTIYAGYWGSKSVYTYLTLPVRREALYAAKLLVFVTGLLLLIGAQLIGIRLGYALVASRANGFEGAPPLAMHNGLFLATARSDFFRLLLPLTFSRALSSFSLLLAVAAGFYYAALCERSRKYWGFAPIAAAVWIVFKVVAYRLNESEQLYAPSGLYPTSLLLLALGGWFVWHSLRLMRRGTIA